MVYWCSEAKDVEPSATIVDVFDSFIVEEG
jgi:hypothetical protein